MKKIASCLLLLVSLAKADVCCGCCCLFVQDSFLSMQSEVSDAIILVSTKQEAIKNILDSQNLVLKQILSVNVEIASLKKKKTLKGGEL